MKKQTIIGMRACVFWATLLLGSLCTSYAWAQTSANYVAVPYSMSFEKTGPDSVELATNLWHMNVGAMSSACEDYWMIGTSTRSDGKRSMYIVHDDSTMYPGYGSSADLQFVYRDFEFSQGTYSSYYVSFDWMNSCKSDSAALYVGYVTYQTGTTPGPRSAAAQIVANSGSGVFPTSLAGANCSGALYNAVNWQSYTFPNPLVVNSNMTYRFYVAWANKGNVSGQGYAACFDNLQITDARCKAPTDIKVTATACDTLLISWNDPGNAQSYDIKFRKVGSTFWSTANYSPSNGRTCLLEGLDEGSYEVRIRSVYYDANGNKLYSAYTRLIGDAIVYCADKHCIAYMDLTNPGVVCTTGDGYRGWSGGQGGLAAFQTVGLVDYGSGDMRSRHTVNWDKTEKDPRTGGLLSVVPSGELASVRLGNWETGAEAEGIAYTYVVDSALSILLLRYACVMEDPEHSEDAQPRFTLEILDETGQRIDPTCGFANFAADSKRKGWRTYGEGYSKVVWKDWTTVGLNLEDYIGRTLTIRLATYDCSQSGHYGYAYFTLDCAGATIESASCGENTRLEASAPSGFKYEWRNDQNVIVSREQQASIVTTDSAEYTCKLISTENDDCWFELKVMALPRFPMADGVWKYVPTNCQNKVEFRDMSYVQTRYHGEIRNRYDESLGGYLWEFNDGSGEISSMPNCSHIFPSKGGTFSVTLSGWLAGGEGECTDDTTFIITLPEIGDRTNVLRDTVCEGTLYSFGDKKLYATGGYEILSKDANGCTVTDSLYLLVAPTHNTNLKDTTLCYGDRYCIDGECYKSDKNGEFVRRLYNRFGCDSVVSIKIAYADPLLPKFDVIEIDENHEYASIILSGTGYTVWTFEGDTTNASRFDGLEGGDYSFHFLNEFGCELDTIVPIGKGCLRNKVYQRWDDVLSLKSTDLNGDLAFDSFQWTFNGEDIPGATMSYIYLPDGLVEGGAYTCRVIISKTKEEAETCTFRPTLRPKKTSAKKIVRGNTVYIVREGETYDLFGNRIQ